MGFVEIAAALWMGFAMAFINTDGARNKLIFKVPLAVFGILLMADGLNRLGLLEAIK